MAIVVADDAGAIIKVDGTAFRAVRTVNRPLDYGSLGSYRVQAATGTMAAALAANAEIAQFRWTDATRLCVIRRVQVSYIATVAVGFAAGVARVLLTPARGWSAAGTGGGTIAFTGNNAKQRTSMGTSLMAAGGGEIRIATTAALGAGTKTLDASNTEQLLFNASTAVNTVFAQQANLFLDDAGDQHPIVLAQNEGIVIRATVPATGTWEAGIVFDWSEVSAY